MPNPATEAAEKLDKLKSLVEKIRFLHDDNDRP